MRWWTRCLLSVLAAMLGACTVVHRGAESQTFLSVGTDFQQMDLDLVNGRFAAVGQNQSKAWEHANRTVSTLGVASILANVQKAADANAADVDKAAIKGSSSTEQARIAADLEKAKSADALKMAELEMMPTP
jgi:hypothetical protein